MPTFPGKTSPQTRSMQHFPGRREDLGVERIAFLVDATGERIDCLVNPETLVIRRLAGVRQAALPGAVIGTGGDDMLLFTGGGRTELVLDLLFDVDLVEPTHRPSDVRT